MVSRRSKIQSSLQCWILGEGSKERKGDGNYRKERSRREERRETKRGQVTVHTSTYTCCKFTNTFYFVTSRDSQAGITARSTGATWLLSRISRKRTFPVVDAKPHGHSLNIFSVFWNNYISSGLMFFETKFSNLNEN